jgi:putative oxidoreductase
MTTDLGIVILRALFGVAIAAHGAQKLFGWFGGRGLRATAGFFETLGYYPGFPFAAACGISEMGGGILLVLGLMTPLGAAAVLGTMLVAIISVQAKNGFSASAKEIELAFLYAVGALSLMFTGPGVISLDALLTLEFLEQPRIVGGLLVLTIVSTTFTLNMRVTKVQSTERNARH